MKKKKIELNILVFILIEALSLLFFFKESLLNIILGTILGVILILLTKKIKLKKFTLFFIFISTIFLLITSMIQTTNFITYNYLKNYSSFIIMITIFIIAFFLANKGYHTYIKALEISCYFFLFIKIISLLLVIPNINFFNFNDSLLKELIVNKNFLYISLLILFLHLSIRYLSDYVIANKTYILSIINPIILKIICVLVMGETLFNIYNYPYFNVLKRIKYLEFIERMEGILSFEYLLCFIFFIAFLILIIKTILIQDKKNNDTT